MEYSVIHEKKSYKLILISLSSLLLVAIVSIAGYYAYQSEMFSNIKEGQKVVRAEPSPLTSLYSQPATSPFSRAVSAERNDDYDSAESFYQEALQNVTTPDEEAHVYYKLARLAEREDVFRAIELFKQVVADETYPDIQKSYAVMWLPLMVSRNSEPAVLSKLLEGSPYSEFADDDLFTVYKNFYEYSLQFGSNGLGEFTVARWQANQLRVNENLTASQRSELTQSIEELMTSGEAWIRNNLEDRNNVELFPRIYRERARAYATLAWAGDGDARANYDNYFEFAIDFSLLSRLDGAIRFDYFVYGYLIEGEASFAKTQKHLDVLVNNFDTYTGMVSYFRAEKDNFFGRKDTFIEMANLNPTFKRALIEDAGWTNADFTF